ncbi:MAG: TlpA family protein disulfide reductase [Gammaproteobacteria bacterium]|nr:TlpA family protein disulfide reductase [Gammaproteobacteria bacterium]
MHVNRFIISIATLYLCFTQTVNAKEFVFDSPGVRQNAPEFMVKDSGRTFFLSEYKGKVVLLNFWSLECKPCIDEMDSLDILSRRFYNQGLRVIAISSDSRKKLKRYIKKHDYHFVIMYDENMKIRRLYEVKGLPTTYIIGRDGKFIARIIGSRDWGSDQIINYFSKRLKMIGY